jgi:hypothetical protein
VLPAGDSNSKVLPAATNSSTQHEHNTAFRASFASDWDTDTIGLIVLIVATAVVLLKARRNPTKRKS